MKLLVLSMLLASTMIAGTALAQYNPWDLPPSAVQHHAEVDPYVPTTPYAPTSERKQEIHWYLMLPPPTTEEQGNFDLDAPLSKWTLIDSGVSLDDRRCIVLRGGLIDAVSSQPKTLEEIKANNFKRMRLGYSHCVEEGFNPSDTTDEDAKRYNHAEVDSTPYAPPAKLTRRTTDPTPMPTVRV